LTADKRLRCFAPSLKLPSVTSDTRKTPGCVKSQKNVKIKIFSPILPFISRDI